MPGQIFFYNVMMTGMLVLMMENFSFHLSTKHF